VQIDWLTVTAQIVNFLVLVWLLKRFLYQPISDAMRRREERIEERLSEARAARKEAEEEAERLSTKTAELEAGKESAFAQARQEAEQLRMQMEADIRAEMETRRHVWKQHLEEERDDLVATLRHQAGQKLFQMTERILADYADSELTERVVARFAARLKTLDPDMRRKMTEAAAHDDVTAIVHTGFEIDSAAKSRITRVIHDVLATQVEVDYRTDPDIVLGARLTIGDHSAEWSAIRYLDRLQAEFGEIIDAGSRSMDDQDRAGAA
jgi:F-type H+-transporting ATPase subunit b